MSMSDAISLEAVTVHEAEAEAPALLECPVGDAVFCSLRAPEKGGPNEDALLITAIDGAIVMAVADGCGGMPSGHTAAATALGAFHDAVREAAPAQTVDAMTSAMLSGFWAANSAVLDLRTGAATTLLAACVVDGVARTVNVGDSMALIVGQRGRQRFAAIAHSLTGYAVEAGMLTEKEAIHHDDRSVVLNVVGDQSMRVDVGPPITLNRRDTVLLASDGLCDNMYPSEIVETIRSGPLLRRVEQLTERSRARMEAAEPGQPGHPDDLTIVAYRPAGAGGR